MAKGKSIRMFLVDGSPDGIVAAEIMNWTGHLLACSRARLPDLLSRSEVERTGVYLLTGPDPDVDGKTAVYIGESDSVRQRLISHNKDESKSFWDRACVVTSKDQNLTKAHVRFLESRLIATAKKAVGITVSNSTAPDYGYLPEADIADMEFFLEQLGVILPVLGFEIMRSSTGVVTETPSPVETAAPAAGAEQSFELVSSKHELKASAREIGATFFVLAGSQARAAWVGKPGSYQSLHGQLLADGTLEATQGGHAIFKQDYPFSSPSAAAAVVYGRQDNGRLSWKVPGTGKTYQDWQDEKIASAAAGKELEPA